MNFVGEGEVQKFKKNCKALKTVSKYFHYKKHNLHIVHNKIK